MLATGLPLTAAPSAVPGIAAWGMPPAAMLPVLSARALGLAESLGEPPLVPKATMGAFTGAPDTLELMRQHAWGEYGEHSVLVRVVAEDIVRGLRGKDYLGEILAIRNFVMQRVRYLNDHLHIEYVKTPERLLWEVLQYGVAEADCDEMAELIATLGLCIGRQARFVVVGFGEPYDYSHVFAEIQEPKTSEWIICDPVAGSDERAMAERVTTYEIWSLDEY